MDYSNLKNVSIMDKGEPPRFIDYGVYEYSSLVTAFNLYEQDWTTLQKHRLTYLYNDDQNEFESKRAKWQRGLSDVS